MSPIRRVTSLLSDIYVAHRTSMLLTKPVICHFISRDTQDLFKKDANVLGDAKIYMNDDLTALRSKLFTYDNGV